MSLASLRSEVAACKAWERALHAGSAETRKAAALPGRWETWLPLVMPIYGLIGWATGTEFSGEGWVLILPYWWLLSFGRLFPRTAPTDWEVLRLPSRRGWLFARWTLRLPWLAHLGLCTAAHHLLLGMRDVPQPEGIRWPLLAALALAPLLFAALSAWFPLQQRAFGGRSWVAPLFALALVFGLLAFAAAVYWKKESGPEDMPLVSGSLAVIAALILLLTLPSLATLLRGAARFSGGSGVASLVLHGMAGLTGLAPATILLICAMFPRSVVIEAGDPLTARIPAAVLALTVAGILVVAANAIRLVASADVGVEPRPEVKVVKRTVPFRPLPVPAAPVRSGGGLRAAAWAIYRARWRTLHHPWLSFVPKLMWEFRGPVCAGVSITIVAFGSSTGGLSGLLSLWLGVVFLAVVPAPLRLPASRRLHLLGGDFAAVALHNLRWGLLLVVLPAAAAGALPCLLVAAKDSPPFLAFAGAWAGAVGFLLLREGAGFVPLARLADKAGWTVSLALVAAWFVCWFLDAPTTLGVSGTVVLALGAESAFREFRDPEAAGRRFETGAADD